MKYFLLVLSCWVVIPAYAQTTTAVPFLGITPDARAAGMGDRGLTTGVGVFGNRAALPLDSARAGVSLDYSPWLKQVTENVFLAAAGAFYKPDESSALSVGLRYFDIGDLPVEDNAGNKLFTAEPREYALDIGYSRRLSGRLGVGVALRYIHSNLGTGSVDGTAYKAAAAVAGDLDLYYDGADVRGQGWSAGLALSNLGSKINYTDDPGGADYLPATLGAGLQYTLVPDEANRLCIGLEAAKLLVPASDSIGDAHDGVVESWGRSFGNDAYRFSAGVEYGYQGVFFLRAGYVWETPAMGDLRYWTFGLGLCWKGTGVDLSYLAPSGQGVLASPLGNTLRLGVHWRF